MLSEKFVYSLLSQAGVLQDDTLVLQFMKENELGINSLIKKENLLLIVMTSYFAQKKSLPSIFIRYIEDNINTLYPSLLSAKNTSGLTLLSLLLSLNSPKINSFLQPYMNVDLQEELLTVINNHSLAELIMSDKKALNTLNLLEKSQIKCKFLNDFHFIKYAQDEKIVNWLLEHNWVDCLAQDKDNKTIYHYISLLKAVASEKIYKDLNKKFTEEKKEAEQNALLVFAFSYSRKLSLFKKFIKNKKLSDINYNGENILSNYINAKLSQNKNQDSHNAFRLDSSKSNYIIKRIEEKQEISYLDCKNEWSAHYLLFKHSYMKGFEEHIYNSIKNPKDFHVLITNMSSVLKKNLESENVDKGVKLSYILSFFELDITGLCLGLMYKSQNTHEYSRYHYNYNSMAKDIIQNEDFELIFSMLMNVSKHYYLIMNDDSVSRKNMMYRHKFENLFKIPYDFKDYIAERNALREGLYYLYYNLIMHTTDRYSESTHALFDIMKVPDNIAVPEITELKFRIKGDSSEIHSIFEKHIIRNQMGSMNSAEVKKKRI